MLDQLTRYFTAAHRFRRSERSFVRAGAIMELEDLQVEARNPKLQSRIRGVLNEHNSKKAKAS